MGRPHFASIHERIAQVVSDIPQLRRGKVWCTVCGYSKRVNAGLCLRAGWPTHCGYTMTIDSPAERQKPTK